MVRDDCQRCGSPEVWLPPMPKEDLAILKPATCKTGAQAYAILSVSEKRRSDGEAFLCMLNLSHFMSVGLKSTGSRGLLDSCANDVPLSLHYLPRMRLLNPVEWH